MTDRRIVVLIADDRAAVRFGLSAHLALQSDISVCGQASNSREALMMAAALKPNVILMNLVMPARDGIGVITRIGIVAPGTQVIVLTSLADDEKIIGAIRAGATGYLMEDVTPHEAAKAVRMVHAGESILAPEVAHRLMDEAAGPAVARAADGLTERQHDVLKLIAKGLSNREIANCLTLSEGTVRTHVSNILRKFHLSDRTQGARYAVRRQLVEAPAGDSPPSPHPGPVGYAGRASPRASGLVADGVVTAMRT